MPLPTSSPGRENCGNGVQPTDAPKYDECDVHWTGCPNQKTIQAIEASVGKLCRIGTLDDLKLTTDNATPMPPCHFVLPQPEFKCDLAGYKATESAMRRDPLISPVGYIHYYDKLDYEQAAISVGHILPPHGNSPKELIDGLATMRDYGFNHIIVIGGAYFGMIFLDCYGHLFVWDSMNLAL
ncbi:hypothetical protein BC937DRAFT_89536 [Endogone sp. FLAS-F59071]|nr:hypothetical protein BC937DRAFT_89536 [Endogone sp. FLAS-F59071]|eukprot:RUS22369.1 hypothetical protein BC937DRAFT_89536 [Endogone sp. FLAS-F59071]